MPPRLHRKKRSSICNQIKLPAIYYCCKGTQGGLRNALISFFSNMLLGLFKN